MFEYWQFYEVQPNSFPEPEKSTGAFLLQGLVVRGQDPFPLSASYTALSVTSPTVSATTPVSIEPLPLPEPHTQSCC